MDFLEVVELDHKEQATVELGLAHSEAQVSDGRLVRVELWIRLLLGSPEMVGGKLAYPVEATGVGTFDRRLHGDAPNERIVKLVLKRSPGEKHRPSWISGQVRLQNSGDWIFQAPEGSPTFLLA